MKTDSSLFCRKTARLLAPQSWMSDFSEVRSSKIQELTLPGSHDSGAFTFTHRVLDQYQTDGIKKVYAAAELLKKMGMGYLYALVTSYVIEQTVEHWARTQATDFAGQLQAGIRWFDLRVMMLDGVTYFYHGFVCSPVSDGLAHFAEFAQAQPGEIVTLSFSHMSTLSADDQVALANSLVTTLGQSALCVASDYAGKTVAQLSSQGTRFVVFNDSAQAPRGQFPFLLTEAAFYFDPTASSADGINSLETLVGKLASGLSPIPSRPAKIGFTITPDTSAIAWSIVNLLTPLTSTHDLKWFTQDVRAALPDWISGVDPNVKLGVVHTDFINTVNLLSACLSRMGVDVPIRPTTIVQPGGVVNIGSRTDFPLPGNPPGLSGMFVDDNGHIWQNWRPDTGWQWDDLGRMPNGLSILTALGSVTDPFNNSPHFMLTIASDGHLWQLASERGPGAYAIWSDCGTPAPNVTISKTIGLTWATSPYGYVLGSDGNLYISQGRTDPPNWTGVGAPSGVSLDTGFGCVTLGQFFSSDQYPYCFVRGSDGNLWCNRWNGETYEWDNLGQPDTNTGIAAPLGAVSSMGFYNDTAYCFCEGTDGVVWYHSSANGWNKQPLGGGVAGITKSMGAVTLSANTDYLYGLDLYVLDETGALGVLQYDNNQFQWKSLGTPPTAGVSIIMPLGTVATEDPRPYCYMLGSDGQVWLNFYSDSFTWQALGDSTPLTVAD